MAQSTYFQHFAPKVFRFLSRTYNLKPKPEFQEKPEGRSLGIAARAWRNDHFLNPISSVNEAGVAGFLGQTIVVMPALNESASVAATVERWRRAGVAAVRVVDNIRAAPPAEDSPSIPHFEGLNDRTFRVPDITFERTAIFG